MHTPRALSQVQSLMWITVDFQVLIHHEGLLGELTCDLPAPPVATVETLANLHVIADAWGGLSLLDTRGDQVPVRLSLCTMPTPAGVYMTSWLQRGSDFALGHAAASVRHQTAVCLVQGRSFAYEYAPLDDVDPSCSPAGAASPFWAAGSCPWPVRCATCRAPGTRLQRRKQVLLVLLQAALQPFAGSCSSLGLRR